MRIGFMLPATFALGNPGNGVRIQALQQAEALRALGHNVDFMPPQIIVDPKQTWDVVHFFQGGPNFMWMESLGPARTSFFSFASMIDNNEPHWRYRMVANIGRMFPRIFTIQGELAKQARAANVVIVRSTHERDRVVHSLGVSADRVHIVLNGAEYAPQADGADIRRQMELPDEFILHISAYTQPRKNVAKLIEAVGPTGLPLVIAGHAPPSDARTRLEKLAAQYGNVRLLGFVDDSARNQLYAACKVFALPSINEGTGLVALEAAAQGAGVVITRNGGPPDYFGALAQYTDPSDVGQMRQAIQAAWANPRGEEARQHVRSNLTLQGSAEGLIKAWTAAGCNAA